MEILLDDGAPTSVTARNMDYEHLQSELRRPFMLVIGEDGVEYLINTSHVLVIRND